MNCLIVQENLSGEVYDYPNAKNNPFTETLHLYINRKAVLEEVGF